LISSAAAPHNARPLPSAALRRFAWAVLVYFIAVILWGTLVRATGSGAGCGDHWPLCNGTVFQYSPSVQTMIEFTHRLTSGISLFAVVGLVAWTFQGTVRGHLARSAAAAAVAFTLIEAILGALLVKLGLTAQSLSPLRPAYLALHLANTLLLLAALTLTAHLLSRREGYLRGSVRLVAPFGAAACIFVVMIVGVTGSLAALGDTLFPASSLDQALSQDFSPTSGWLVHWRWMHPAVAFIASIFLIWLLFHAAQQPASRTPAFRTQEKSGPAAGQWDNRRLSAQVLLLLASVYTLGVLDVVLLAPLWVQVAHLLGADTLWVSLVVLTARLTIEPRERC
jgi:cytochrome c oxidase assembly protein subunit 15